MRLLGLLTLLTVLVYSFQAQMESLTRDQMKVLDTLEQRDLERPNALYGIDAEFEADYLVVRRYLNYAWDYAGMYELVEALVNHLCDEFPELTPTTNKEMSMLKDQTWKLLFRTKGYSELPAYEWDKKVLDNLSTYSLVDAKVKQLRELGKLYFAKLSESERKGKYSNDDTFILYHLEEPVRQLIQSKIESYQERGLSRNQIDKEITKNDAAVIEAWEVDGDERKKETAVEEDMFDSEYSLEVLLMVGKRDLVGALQYAGMFEIVDVLINYVCDEFPELTPATDKEIVQLKSQTFDLLVHMKTHSGKGTRVWETQLEEDLPKYSLVAAKFKQLRKLSNRAFSKLSEADKKEYINELVFLNYHVEKPVRKLLLAKMESYEERGLTRKQIKKEIVKKDEEVRKAWRKDNDPLQEKKAKRVEKEDDAIDFNALNHHEL